jgi:hypothetical protein
MWKACVNGREPAGTRVASRRAFPYKAAGNVMHPWLLNKVGKPHLIDPWWRKARIAARIILKRRAGQPLSARDRRLARRLGVEPGVTNRLVDQAVNFTRARQNGHRLVERGN